jgi:hypothetical protein
MTKRTPTLGDLAYLYQSPTYRSWAGMKQRCNKPTQPAYHRYGGRGITYDPAWEKFPAFFADMGECPEGLTLEREDNNLGYNKENCVWATRATQSQNREVCKLDAIKVEHIRAMYVAKNPDVSDRYFARVLADVFKVHYGTIRNLIYNRKWVV